MGQVTAIVSAYYAEQFIKGRIVNLLEQVPQPEVVVVARTGTPEAMVARKFGDVVQLIETAGVPTLYDAWNIAIKASKSEYITNANSDDLLYPGALDTMSRLLDEHPEIALCYSDSDVTRVYGEAPVNRLCWIDGGVDDIKKSCFMGSMPMWRRCLHTKYGYFDEMMKSAGDYEFWLRIMINGEKVKHIPQALGAYLERDESIWHSKPLLSIWEVARARSRYLGDSYGKH